MMKKIFTFFAALACTVSMFAATETVYFVNAQNWTGTINAYAWTSASNAQWPGVPATKEAEKIAGYDVYSYTAEAGTYANVIFNNGSSQTADLKWTAGKYYCKDGWYTKEDAAAKLGQPVEYESVYFVNVDSWANVQIYTWLPEVAGWPGVAMTKEAIKIADKEVWSYTVEKGTTFGGMLFNDGNGTQTSDLKWEAGKYFVKDKWYTKEEAEAKLSGDTPVDPNPGDDPVVTPTAYYITGNEALFGADQWKADAIAMTEAEGVYTHTFTAVAAGVECQFKVTNGTWDQSWGFADLTTVPAGVTGNNDNNIIFTLAEAGDVTVNFNGKNITLVGNFTQSGDTTVTPEPNPGETKTIYLNTGGAQLWNQADAKFFVHAWGGAADLDAQMTLVAGDIYQVEIAHTSIIFLRLAPAATGVVWEGENLWNKTADLEIPEGMNCYTITGWGETDGTWSSYTPGDTPVDPNPGDDPVVTPTAYYITGNEALFGADQWKADAIAMTEAEGVYTHTFTAVAAGVECQFKVTNGTWDQSWGFADLTTVPAGVTGNNDNNIIFTLAEAGDVTVNFNGKNITLVGNFTQSGDTTVTPEPNPGETKTIYLNTGGAQLWNQADAKFFVHAWGEGATDLDAQMTLVEGDVYQVEIAAAHTSIIFLRLAPTATGVVWEGNDLWNKTVDLTIPAESNCYTITGWEPEAGTWSSYTPGDTPVDPNPGDDPVVTPTAYYITGNEALFGADQWKADAIAMTEAEGVYTHTFTAVAAGVECQFKVTNGTWDQSWGFADLTTVPAGVTGNNDNNIIFTLAEAGDVTVNFNGKNITLVGNFTQSGDTTVTPEPNPGETKTIYLNTGGAQLWNQADAKFFVHAWGGAADLDAQMTLVAGDIYQVEIAHTSIIFLRLAPAATGVVWEGENLWNKTADLEIPEGMNCYTITGWGEKDGTWSSYTPVDGPTTDNEQVVINKKATKIVYNGQICIIRDGVMFNILGQVIK